MQTDKKPSTITSRKLNKEKAATKYYKKNSSSDDDEDDSTEEEEEEEQEEKFDINKYRSMLAEMFPSKYMNEKVKKINETAAATAESSPKKRRRLTKAIVSDSESEEQEAVNKRDDVGVEHVADPKTQQPVARPQIKPIEYGNIEIPQKLSILPSPLHGNGVYSKEPIQEGELVEKCRMFRLGWRMNYQKDPVQTIKTNVHGTINLLGLARRTNSRI